MSTKAELIKRATELGYKPPSSLCKDQVKIWLAGACKLADGKGRKVEGKQGKINYAPLNRPEGDWLEHLQQHGWTTVPVDIDSEYYQDQFWQYLESSGQLSRDDPRSWNNIPPNYHGIFKSEVAHLDWIWQIRLATVPIWQQIYRCDELLTGFDGCCFLNHRPRAQGWIHSDHHRWYTNTERENEHRQYQGIVNLVDCGDKDGGLVLNLTDDALKSYSLFEQYLQDYPLEGVTGLLRADLEWPGFEGSQLYKINAKAGEMVLWDSRIFHGNTPSTKKYGYRMVSYVSMLPKEMVPKANQKKLRSYFEKGKQTNHDINGPYFRQCQPVRTYGQAYPQCSGKMVNKEDEEVRELAGAN